MEEDGNYSQPSLNWCSSKDFPRATRIMVRKVRENPMTTRKEIQDELMAARTSVTKRTISNELRRHDLRSHRPRKTPLLKKKHRDARLKFAHEYLDKPKEFWDTVMAFFIDGLFNVAIYFELGAYVFNHIFMTMVKKCCVYGCKTNYKSEQKHSLDSGNNISVFRFPKDQSERELWVKAVPNANLNVTDNTVICALHWPPHYEHIKVFSKLRPKNPPSVWHGIPTSQIPTPPPPPRSTNKASCSFRNLQEDEYDLFVKMDRAGFVDFKTELLGNKRTFSSPVTAFMGDEMLYIQSLKYSNGVPLFLIKVHKSLRFETFHMGVKCNVKTLSSNYITCLNSWSKLEEVIRYLQSVDTDHKKVIIHQQLAVMATKVVGFHLYDPAIITRAFEYFATSRALYNRLRHDYQLPSISTLTRITSRIAQVSDNSFLNSVFSAIEDRQKLCVILHDEVYVKKMLLYHGGTVFGRAIDDNSSLAKTILGIMIVCLFGGPKFLSKMLPVSKLTSTFLHEQIHVTQQAIESAGGTVKAIICDGNRINKAFFGKYTTLPEKPWLTVSGSYLLFDFVHLLKNLRNLWLTEQLGELVFEDGGVLRTAKWAHLRQLYKLELESKIKMSELTEVAVTPKPVERQKVITCLKVFSERTYHALLNHSGLSDDKEDTAIFLNKVITWWKIINVKMKGASIASNDPLQAEISDPLDPRLNTILEFGDMVLKMAGKQGKRVKQLSKDTAAAVYNTCYGLVDLCKNLLASSHEYVLLGKFTTDHLEKEFSKIRQGSGGTYFISVQQVIEKLHIKQSSLLLSLDVNIDNFNVVSGHHCSSCAYTLSEEGSAVFDNLTELEESIPEDTKKSLIYIAGYVTRKDSIPNEDQLLSVTTFYHEKYGGFVDSMDRGGLNIPTDSACQWTFFCHIIFSVVKDKMCRKSLCDLFMQVSEFHEFGMTRNHGNILSNIFLKNLCQSETPRSGKEPAVKVLKLS